MIRRNMVLLGVVLVAVLTPLAVKNWLDRPVWPGFPENPGGKLQSQVKFVNDRDFGYRTGNHVPVTLYVKVPSGATVKLDSLTVRGDMTLLDKKVFTQEGENGVLYVRYDLTLIAYERKENERKPVEQPNRLQGAWQSLQQWQKEKPGPDAKPWWDVVLKALSPVEEPDPGYKPFWHAIPSVTWRKPGGTQTEQVDLEAADVYWSLTFDGRKGQHPHEPELKLIGGYHGVVTLAWLGTGIGGMLFCIGYLWVNRKRRIKPVVQPVEPEPVAAEEPVSPRERLRATLAAVISGDHSVEKLRDLAVQLRGDELRTYAELEVSKNDEDRVKGLVLRICEHAGGIWSQSGLTEQDLNDLELAQEQLFPTMGETSAPQVEEGDATTGGAADATGSDVGDPQQSAK